MLSILFFGFASGLPFLLILSTLSIWLADIGVSKTLIGLFALSTLPYTFKFLLGPLVDNYRVPLLGRWLGLRRGWILLAQLGLFFSILGLANSSPRIALLQTAIWAFMVGAFSALQDLAIEAYRIEKLPANKLSYGVGVSAFGYRLGMLCSGAGTIYLAAQSGSWQLAYNIMAYCVLIGMATTLACSEPRQPSALVLGKEVEAQQHLRLDWSFILPFILCFKFADTVLNVMTMPFLLEVGFSKLQIAYVAKTFGIIAMILGSLVAAMLLAKRGIWRNLRLCIILQFSSAALFVVQAKLGARLDFLFISMGLENFSCGMAQVLLITYLSKLCSPLKLATHFAMLSSFASIARVAFSVLAGIMADHLPWVDFYSLVALSCIPGFILSFKQRGKALWQSKQIAG